MIHDYAVEVAVEHVNWCRSQGQRARQVLLDIGIRTPAHALPDWDDVTLKVAKAWMALGSIEVGEAA